MWVSRLCCCRFCWCGNEKCLKAAGDFQQLGLKVDYFPTISHNVLPGTQNVRFCKAVLRIHAARSPKTLWFSPPKSSFLLKWLWILDKFLFDERECSLPERESSLPDPTEPDLHWFMKFIVSKFHMNSHMNLQSLLGTLDQQFCPISSASFWGTSLCGKCEFPGYVVADSVGVEMRNAWKQQGTFNN